MENITLAIACVAFILSLVAIFMNISAETPAPRFDPPAPAPADAAVNNVPKNVQRELRKPKVVDDYRAMQIEREQIKRRTPLA